MSLPSYDFWAKLLENIGNSINSLKDSVLNVIISDPLSIKTTPIPFEEQYKSYELVYVGDLVTEIKYYSTVDCTGLPIKIVTIEYDINNNPIKIKQ